MRQTIMSENNNLTSKSSSFALAHLDNQKPCSARFWLQLTYNVMHKIKNTLSLLIALILLPINANAHGITNEIVVLIFLVVFSPAIISTVSLFIAKNKRRNKKPSEIWFNVAKVFALIQFLVILYFVVK